MLANLTKLFSKKILLTLYCLSLFGSDTVGQQLQEGFVNTEDKVELLSPDGVGSYSLRQLPVIVLLPNKLYKVELRDILEEDMLGIGEYRAELYEWSEVDRRWKYYRAAGRAKDRAEFSVDTRKYNRITKWLIAVWGEGNNSEGGRGRYRPLRGSQRIPLFPMTFKSRTESNKRLSGKSISKSFDFIFGDPQDEVQLSVSRIIR